MPTHHDLLNAMSARALRAIATSLRVEPHNPTNAQRVPAIAAFWAQPERAQHALAQLSPAALAALQRLALAAPLPAALFFADYGPIRPAQRRSARGEAPWRRPANPAEELYYRGLLFPQPSTSIAKTRDLLFPDDLRTLVPSPILPSSADISPDEAEARGAHAAASLDHDLAQLLILLHVTHTLTPEARLLHRRWLRPSLLAELQKRLLHPDAGPAVRSHRQTERPRLLMALATAAGLHEDGVITPAGWAWLDAPPARRAATLWQGYLDAGADLRSAYLLPDAGLPPPWPALLARALAQLPPFATLDTLVTALLHAQPDASLYWSLHLPGLSALDDLAAAVVQHLLAPLGICLPILDHHGRCRALVEAKGAQDQSIPPSPAVWRRNGEEFLIGCDGVDRAAAQLAPYADWDAIEPAGERARHTWRISQGSVQRAAAAGCPLPPLIDALRSLGLAPTPDDWQQIARRHAAVGSVRVGLWPLLRTESRPHMQAILADARTLDLAQDLLAPTAALLHNDPRKAVETLRAAGWHVDDEVSQSTDSPPSTPQKSASPRAPSSTTNLPPGEQPALWLAGQLYRLLAHHLALPLPPPSITLESLYARFPPSIQAALSAARDQVEQDLLSLLDGDLPFTPPLAETDGDHWRTQIAAAMADGRRLDMVYLSPARGLPTRRTIDPYALVERRGFVYLRAFCLRTDRVLDFRLDRIQALD